MSWTISAMGTKAAVIEQIKKQKVTGDSKDQFESVQELILAELEELPKGKGTNGVNVQAAGSSSSATRQLSISITPIEILFTERQLEALKKAGEEAD